MRSGTLRGFPSRSYRITGLTLLLVSLLVMPGCGGPESDAPIKAESAI